MKPPYYLWSYAGLRHYARRSVIPASGVLWTALVIYAFYFLHFSMVHAILWGLASVISHWLGELWHQLGHAFAAHRTGFPMQSILLKGLLGASVYPSQEQELADRVHIRRAIGGPAASLLLAAAAGFVVYALRPDGPLLLNLMRFMFAENLLIFTIGSLLPLGFTDGSTILRYLRAS